jgi:hypothetical protein
MLSTAINLTSTLQFVIRDSGQQAHQYDTNILQSAFPPAARSSCKAWAGPISLLHAAWVPPTDDTPRMVKTREKDHRWSMVYRWSFSCGACLTTEVPDTDTPMQPRTAINVVVSVLCCYMPLLWTVICMLFAPCRSSAVFIGYRLDLRGRGLITCD